MEPNFQVWLRDTDRLEDWAKELILTAGQMYQAELQTAKQELENFYGNNIQSD